VSGTAAGETSEAEISEAELSETEMYEAEDIEQSATSEEQMLLAFWRVYKESHPESTIEDFYKSAMATNSEVE
jgi:hypothetical protein